jgi:hypothetical protein
LLTAGAASFKQFAMHVDDVCTAGAFVQIVDILSDKRHLGRPGLLQFTQSQMGRVRKNGVRKQLATAGVVELVNALRISPESLRRCDVFDVYGGPDAIGIAEGVETGLARDSSAGQDDDV